MALRSTQNFGFPPFTGGVRQLILVQSGIFLVLFALKASSPATVNQILEQLALIPDDVVRGKLWQLVSYSFLHMGFLHLLFNMLSLWMFGAQLEQDWGKRRFFEFYFFSVIGASVVTTALAFTHIFGMSPEVATIGASGGVYGLIVAFGVLYSRMRILVYGIFPIEARWFAILWVLIALFGVMSGEPGGVNNMAHLGGALFGYIFLKALPKRGITYGVSESWYGLRNRYHKWKRRQAAKKFEVYMREHDRSQYFDEHGNYRDPGKKENGDAGKGPWVN